MANTPAPEIDPVRSVIAAGAAAWRVAASSRTVVVSSWDAGKLHGLIGSWGLEEFSLQFDGLHRLELIDVLSGARDQSDIDLCLMLGTGERAHFRGRRDGAGDLEGLLFLDPATAGVSSPLSIEAVFQPIVRLVDREVAGFECLARLRRDDGTLVAVDAAHPVLGIGPAMARQAVAFLDSVSERHANCFVNLNLSALELGDADAVREIAETIGGAKSGRVRVELTEQAAFRDWDSVREALGVLSAAGAGIVLDDFGAGHSSMIWLSQLEVAGVKLDAGLLRNIDTAKGKLIVQRLVSLLDELGMEVVLEGVEDLAMVPKLIELGGVLAQGFALGGPVSSAQIDADGGAG